MVYVDKRFSGERASAEGRGVLFIKYKNFFSVNGFN